MNLRSALSLALITLCFGRTVHAELNIAELNSFARRQNYGPIRDIAYNVQSLSILQQQQFAQWMLLKADEGHAPIMYFYVRGLSKSNFANYAEPVIIEALKYMYICLVRIWQDESCLVEVQPGRVYKLFRERYGNKLFANVDTSSAMQQAAIGQAREWFRTRKLHSALPPPYWVAFCEDRWTFSWHMTFNPVDWPESSQLFIAPGMLACHNTRQVSVEDHFNERGGFNFMA